MNPFVNHPLIMEMHARERMKDLRREAEMWRLAELARAGRKRENSRSRPLARTVSALAATLRRIGRQRTGPVAC